MNISKQKISLMMIVICYLFITIYFSVYFWNRDYDIAKYWVEQKTKPFYGIFMNRTIFDGEGFGGQDFSNITIGMALFLYILSFNRRFQERIFFTRKYTGFMLGVALIETLNISRLLRGFFGRARPCHVMEGKEVFTHMLTFGPYNFDEALNHGSFPSGHTFSAMFLLTLAFISLRTKKTFFIFIMFLLSIAYGISMGTGRVMFGAHYPGDILWSIAFSIPITAWLYFKGFQIPDQEKGILKINYTPLEGRGIIINIINLKKSLWELYYSLLFIFFSMSIFTLFSGIKNTFLDFSYYWPFISLLGMVLSILFYSKLSRFKHEISE
ncbi:MAG: phosphatase PAP2 family protein [Candidatus Eremiobacterota bacterium]